MKTEIENISMLPNEYIQEVEKQELLFNSDEAKWQIGLLLKSMRPKIEMILVKWGYGSNEVSQSMRAKQTLSTIKDMIIWRGSGGFEGTKQFMRDQKILEDFLAVHRTVWILEGKPL